MNKATLVKIALIPRILEAAILLKQCKLIKIEPSEVVRIYVVKNPDISAHINELQATEDDGIVVNPSSSFNQSPSTPDNPFKGT